MGKVVPMRRRYEQDDLLARMSLAHDAPIEFDLTSTQAHLLWIIAFKDGGGRGCFASLSTLCDLTSLSDPKTIRGAIKGLEKLGIVTVERRAGTTSVIRIAPPAATPAATPTATPTENPLSPLPKIPPKQRQEPSPVGDNGSCQNRRKLSLAINAESRLVALHIDDGYGNGEPDPRVRIDVPGFDETAVSMPSNPKTKAWDAWCKAEGIGKFDSMAEDQQKVLVSFAAFVFTSSRMNRRKATSMESAVAWMSKQWQQAEERSGDFDWSAAHWIERVEVGVLNDGGNLARYEGAYRTGSVVALVTDVSDESLTAWQAAVESGAFGQDRSDMGKPQADAQRALAIHVVRNRIDDAEEIARLWEKGGWKLAPEDDVVLMDGKLVARRADQEAAR